MIEIENVSFRYKSDAATGGVQNVSLSVSDGQVVVFCGESGCRKTVILSEHGLYYLRRITDRYIYVRNGAIDSDYTAEQFSHISETECRKMGLRTNDLATLTVTGTPKRPSVSAKLANFRFAYKNAPETLKIDSASLPFGGIMGIIGHNGAGKSTFSRCFCGLEKHTGIVTIHGNTYRARERLNRCYMVMQDVGHQLFTESVLDEVLISMAEEDEKAAREILERLDLASLTDRHLLRCRAGRSSGLSSASAVTAERPVLFPDEPTSGLDYRHMREVAELWEALDWCAAPRDNQTAARGSHPSTRPRSPSTFPVCSAAVQKHKRSAALIAAQNIAILRTVNGYGLARMRSRKSFYFFRI